MSTATTDPVTIGDPSFAIPIRQAKAVIMSEYNFEPIVGSDKQNAWIEIDKLKDKEKIPAIMDDLRVVFGQGFEVSLMMDAGLEAIIVSKFERQI